MVNFCKKLVIFPFNFSEYANFNGVLNKNTKQICILIEPVFIKNLVYLNMRFR